MIKPTDEMRLPEWRLHTDLRIAALEKYRKNQGIIWWTVAGSIGTVLLPRFIQFLLDSGALSGSPQ